MFCLRTWITLLVFLTNASPLYIFLFLTATYALQRPCVYCSILLFVLVFSLFDFDAPWFDTKSNIKSYTTVTSLTGITTSWWSGSAAVTEALSEATSLALCAINGTGGSVAGAAVEGMKRRVGMTGEKWGVDAAQNVFELLRAGLEKWHFRIPCVDVVVRL